MIIFTDKNDPFNVNVDGLSSGINYSTDKSLFTNFPTLPVEESLNGFSIPAATNTISKLNRTLISGIEYTSNYFNISATLNTTTLSTLDKNETPIFFYTDYMPVTIPTISDSPKLTAGVSFYGSIPHNDMLSNTNITTITLSSIPLGSKNIKFIPELTGINFTSTAITNVKTNMELLFKNTELPLLNLSILDKVPINLKGISNLNNEFLVLNEALTEIIYKGPLTVGSFTKTIVSNDSKVHVISVPSDNSKNFIPFRNITIK